jgi:hypothetical protein
MLREYSRHRCLRTPDEAFVVKQAVEQLHGQQVTQASVEAVPCRVGSSTAASVGNRAPAVLRRSEQRRLFPLRATTKYADPCARCASSFKINS